MKTLTKEQALEIIKNANERSLAIRRGVCRPIVKRIADKGNTAFSIRVIYEGDEGD